MSFAADVLEDASTLFARRAEPHSAAQCTERARLRSGGIEVEHATLPESAAGPRTVREVGVGSGDINQSAGTMTLLSQERQEFAAWAYGDGPSRERRLKKQVSLGDLMRAKPADATTRGKLARSRSLAMLGKSTSKTKNGVIQTKDLFQGIHRTKDLKAPSSQSEHMKRVLNREHTPWVAETRKFGQRFAPVRDSFVAKYQPLLNEHQKQNQVESLALRSRQLLLKRNLQKQHVSQLKSVQAEDPHGLDGRNKLVMRDGRVFDIGNIVNTVAICAGEES